MADDTEYCGSCGSTLPAADRGGADDRGPSRHPADVDGTCTLPPAAETSIEPDRCSVLHTLAGSIGQVPRVHLRDTEPADAPLATEAATPLSPGMPGLQDRSGRYRLLGELARGGMGAILRGHDTDLGRDLAIKVLLDEHRDSPEMIRRFIEEAQIGGQLQHPGVVAIYDMGTLDDRRPFFTMKLVKGQTLATLLQDRKDPSDGLARFLSIFEQVCQTMAYAHTRGVIHRDLKPSNIMVGGFGEVQVMDWGLAKVLPRDRTGYDAPAEAEAGTSVIHVGGPDSDAGASTAGTILGTPSYMAPEQARGDTEQVDERADVFGLGAILCEILTGRPAFMGRSSAEIQRKAARGELAQTLTRLETCGAEPGLIDLARQCLAPERDDRPPSAREVVAVISTHLASIQERLRQAEWARIEANARAAEERKRRKLTMGLAASIIGTIVAGGGAWYATERQRSEHAARLDLAVREAEVLRLAAEQAGDDPGRWVAARQAAHAVERLLADARDEPSRRRITRLVEAVTTEALAADADRKVVDKLIDIRSAKGDDSGGFATDRGYADAFREAGIDAAAAAPADAAAKIKARPPAAAAALVAALDDWATVRNHWRHDHSGADQLARIVRAADPDPWRNGLRDALASSDKSKRRDALQQLARSAKLDELSPVSLDLLGSGLRDAGDPDVAERVLRDAQVRHPRDLWLNYDLAECLERLGRHDQAIRYYMSARSIRPETAHELAHALQHNGEPERALTVFQELVRLRPHDGRHLGCLGGALQGLGREREADAALDAAITALREDIRERPDDAAAHANLGLALMRRRQFEEAVVMYRAAIRIRPESGTVYNNLGVALREQSKLAEAADAYREAIRLKNDPFGAQYGLAITLARQGKHADAVDAYREAIRIKPDDAWAHANLGLALHELGKLPEAIDAYREAIRIKPDVATFHVNLGNSQRDRRKLPEAIDAYRHAIKVQSDCIEAHQGMAWALHTEGKREEAIKEYREAIRLKPDYPWTHTNLGNALREVGKLPEALAAYRETIRLKPDYAEAHVGIGNVLRDQGKLPDAVGEYRKAVRIDPRDAPARQGLAWALHTQGNLEEAIDAYREAIRIKPDYAWSHSGLGNALYARGQLEDAIDAHREAVRLKPDDADYRYGLGAALDRHGKRDEALAAFREAIRLNPGNSWFHHSLGHVLKARGNPDEAFAEFSEAIRLKPDDIEARHHLASILEFQKKIDRAIDTYREAVRLKPDDVASRLELGQALDRAGRRVEAIAEIRQAIRLKPNDPKAHCDLGQLLRLQGRYAEALASLRRGHELGSMRPDWRFPSNQWVRECEQQVALEAKLPAILKGEAHPADAAESRVIARICYDKQWHVATVRIWRDAFRRDPKRLDDLQSRDRYNAACSAALAGAGADKGDSTPSDAERTQLRQQALDWLKADLAAWGKPLQSGPPEQDRTEIARTLAHWKEDPDLAGIRDDASLKALPEAEQKALRAFWDEVEATRKRAGAQAREKP